LLRKTLFLSCLAFSESSAFHIQAFFSELKRKKCMAIIHIPMEINMDWHVEDDDDDHEDKGITLNAKYLD